MLKTNEFKSDLLLTLDQSLAGIESSDKLIIHTSDGLILGRLAYKDDFKYDEKVDSKLTKNDRNNKIFFSTAYKTFHLFRDDKIDKDEESIYPTGVWLKDVVIKSNSQNTLNVSYYFLFFEQVIGVTAGSPENN